MRPSIAGRLAEIRGERQEDNSRWQLTEVNQERPEQSANASMIAAVPPSAERPGLDLEKIERESAQERKEAQKASKQSDEQLTRDLIKGIDIVVNQHDSVFMVLREPFMQIESLDSQRGKDFLMKRVFDQTGRAPNPQLIERELGPIRAIARLNGERVQTHLRMAKEGSQYILDLGDGRTVNFRTDAPWAVQENHAVHFVRGSTYGTLPEPVRPSSAADAFIGMKRWLQAWGLGAEKAALLLVAIVNMLRPGVTQLIIQIHGPAGSAKSTLQALIAGLVDPTVSGSRPMTKLTESDIAAVASNVLILCADNLSKLGVDEQDLLCKIATGTMLAFRRLYTQNEVFQAEVRAPFIITSLVLVIKAADAQSRTLTIPLPLRTTHRSSEDVRAEYEAIKPQLLGYVCELFAAALAILHKVKEQRQWHGRLVDYQQLGEAVFQASGHEPGEFLSIFDKDREQMAMESAESDPFTKALCAVLEDFRTRAKLAEKLPPTIEWSRPPKGAGYACVKLPSGHVKIGIRLGTLLDALKTKALSRDFLTGEIWMPRTERQLSEALVRATPTLQDLGWSAQANASSGVAIWVFLR